MPSSPRQVSSLMSSSTAKTHTTPSFFSQTSSMESVCAFANNPCLVAVNPVVGAAKPQVSLPELRFRRRSRYSTTIQSVSTANSVSPSMEENPGKNVDIKGTEAVEPVYEHTPANRPLRTPHSGYHFDGTTRKFFEGWYLKVAIPELRQSFCFMYSVENPAFPKKLSRLEEEQYGPRFTGVGAQILGADDKYICQYTEESHNFWAERDDMSLGNTFVGHENMLPPKKEVPPQEFNQRVVEGFQVTPLWHQGFIRDDGRTNHARIVKTARWQYNTCPVYGWGNVGSKQKSTAGWLAIFPVFGPYWQICMSRGLSTGWIEWDDKRFEFKNAPSYSEKNWGVGFPTKWFWVQCNVFEGATGDVTLTVAGGLRQLPGLGETFENAAVIGIHSGGIFYEFVPWNGMINWEVTQWGQWCISADNGIHMVELEATTKEPDTTLRAPTSEAGFAPACRDTCFAHLRLRLWEKRYDGIEGKVILDVTSDMAAVEVGGGPWCETWKANTHTPGILRRAVALPFDVEGFFSLVPSLRPPGL